MKRTAALLFALSTGAWAASANLQVYFQKTLTDASYQQKAFNKVAKVWRQPAKAPQPGHKTVVQVVIARDGKLVSALVSMESGSKAWDAAALKAVQKAAPFPALPSSLAEPTVEAHFHFAWQ